MAVEGRILQLLRAVPREWKPARFTTIQLRLPSAAENVRRQFGHLRPREPSPYELREVYHKLLTAWRERRHLDDVPRPILRRAPYVLFLKEQKPILGDEPAFLQAYFRRLDGVQPVKTSLIRTLLFVYLRDYPEGRPGFDVLRQHIGRLLNASTSPLLESWRVFARRYELFQPGAPRRVAEAWFGRSTPAQLLRNAGFEGELAGGEFMRAVFREVCHYAEKEARRDTLSDDDFRWFLNFVTVKGADSRPRLRFQNERAPFANALLRPYEEVPPPPDRRRQITHTLLDILGDPRQVAWPGVPDETVMIFKRWLVESTLEDFFRILDRTADPYHWTYRREFWLAYYRAGYIDDACFALGSDARAVARRANFDLRLDFYSRLEGAQSNQSVLLLKIDNLVIAEWSHSGACRIWTDASQAPPFHKRRYDRKELMDWRAIRVPHQGSVNHRWQHKVASIINQYTQIPTPTWHLNV